MSQSANYEKLLSELHRLHELSSVMSLLGWDEEVNLPAKSGPLRASQHGALAAALHRDATAQKLGELIAGLHAERDRLDPEARAVVELAHRDFREATSLPGELVERRARLGSESCLVWRKARAAKDFSAFAPYLERQIAITHEIAGHLGYAGRAYDYSIDRHDPGLDEAFVADVFGKLRAGLTPLSREILAAHPATPVQARPKCDAGTQLAFCREVTAALGFDYERGRIDPSTHPFCAGSADDCRITTRFTPDNPTDALLSSIHEAGHGMYAQGLAASRAGDAAGRDAGMGVHESQSRLWENQVARSPAFWRWCAPKLSARFPDWAPGEDTASLARLLNTVAATVIRTEADEATYNQHILLRFDLERRLLSGSLSVRDIPEAWRELSNELLGVVPRHDGEGALQDIHWSWGEFGYFPSYTLGNMIAASLWETFRTAHPDWATDFENGRFAPLLAFLRERVHRHGRLLGPRELCLNATGSDISPDALLRHLRERYL